MFLFSKFGDRFPIFTLQPATCQADKGEGDERERAEVMGDEKGGAQGTRQGRRDSPGAASRSHVGVSVDSSALRPAPLGAPSSHRAQRRTEDISKLTGDQTWGIHRDISLVALKL